MESFDAVIVVSFGGPEGMDDVMPFLQNVLRGRNVPPERMHEVARQYELFGGVSPINDQNRLLIAKLKVEFENAGIKLPIYWGNRNWHPLLADTVRQMSDDGVKRALAFVTSAFSSYSGCRQYLEDIARARATVGHSAPEIFKLRGFYNHPGFIEPVAENVHKALSQITSALPEHIPIVFTAHSIPSNMALTCAYEQQLDEACRLVMDRIGSNPWKLVYQSRSGPPTQPWLEPDIGDFLGAIKSGGMENVVVMPIGFISDHMEVQFDLDTKAQKLASELGLHMVRARTVGVHPKFTAMIRDLVRERTEALTPRSLGALGCQPNECPTDCCNYQPRPAAARPAE